jgi:hypothetical protein
VTKRARTPASISRTLPDERSRSSFKRTQSLRMAFRNALEQYRTSTLFVTELTKDKKINRDTFARMSRFYSERQICETVWLVASEHF